MKIWKKTTGLVLAFLMAASVLSGCGGKTESPAPSEASSAASSEASSTTSSTASSEAETAGEDEYDYGAGLTEDGFFEGVTALDYVTLADYKGMEIPADELDISDEDLNSQIDAMLLSYATPEHVTDRAVADGDTVNIDYVGSVDGVEFAGGSTQGSGTTVTIGVTSYIDDFLEQLIGHMPGDTFDVNVTFPDPYANNTDLSGKDAVFVTTVNYIEEDVKPQLTDEFVTENWKDTEGWTTAAQLKDGVRLQMKRAAAWNYLWEQIQEKSEIKETPSAIADYHLENMKFYYTNMAKQYSMTIGDFLSQYMGVESMDDLVEQNREAVDENVKNALLFQALCEDLGFSVTEEKLTDYLKKTLGSDDFSQLEEYYGKRYLYLIAREDLIKQEVATLRVPE